MLRELADGGRHFDVATLRRLDVDRPDRPRSSSQGRDEGVFASTDPLSLHFVLLGSTMLFNANAPIRRRVHQLGSHSRRRRARPFVRYLQHVALRMLRKDAHHGHRPIDMPSPLARALPAPPARARHGDGLPRKTPQDRVRVSGHVEADECSSRRKPAAAS